MSQDLCTEAEEVDRLADAKRQGQAQFDSIKEMVEALRVARDSDQCFDGGAFENAEQAIHEDALSVQVRSGWYDPGASEKDREPAEYEILLCTGGPACKIVGQLSEHCEPETAKLEVQDWFTPWTEFRPIADREAHAKDRFSGYDSEPVLLAYACCFWFGE